MSDEVIWRRPARPARGPRPTRSRDEIVAAAIEVADADGIEATSMRRVAAAVGLGTMSLYRYVPTKSDLVDLMLDAVSGEYDLPEQPSGDWKADLRALAHQGCEIMRRHPWSPHVVITRPSMGPNVLRYTEFCLAVLEPAGLEPGRALEVVALLNATVASYAANELSQSGGGAARSRESAVREQSMARQQSMAEYVREVVDDGNHPRLARAMSADPSSGERFDRLLDLLFAGLGDG